MRHWFAWNEYSLLFIFLIKLIAHSNRETLVGLVKNTLVIGCEDVKTSLISDGMTSGGGIGGGGIMLNISLWHTKSTVSCITNDGSYLLSFAFHMFLFQVSFAWLVTLLHSFREDTYVLRSLKLCKDLGVIFTFCTIYILQYLHVHVPFSSFSYLKIFSSAL